MNRFRAAAPATVAGVAALALGLFGLGRGTWAAGGSDSACYALMAEAFAGGWLQPTTGLADAPWPDASLTLAPAGFVPSPLRSDAASPICAPGFSAFLALLVLIAGLPGVFLLTPLAGAVLVWLSFRIGRRLGGSWAGAIAAVLVATTPIVLFQVVQPMNDVFVTALWTGTVAALTAGERRRVTVAGALAGAALLVRPNLLPVGVVVAAWLFLTGRADDAVAPLKGGARAVARFGLGAVPFGLVVLWLNHALYGGAFRSGYGNPADLFAWSHVSANAALHVRAIVETQAGLPLLGFAAPWMLRGARREAMLAWLVAAAVIVCYLPYQPFPEWWYVRFLMPALVLLVMLSVAVASRFALAAWGSGVGAWGVAMRVGLLGGATLLGVYQVRVAGERGTFDLQRMESRYRHVGEAMLDHLPPATVALSVWNSGSVRFHGRREAVLWDSLDPAWMDRAAAWLLAQGRPPVIVVERWEEPQFRARFGARSSIGALDWPPRIDVDGLIRIYDPADRVRYLAGQQVETTIVAPRR